jgi:hypothetical protein
LNDVSSSVHPVVTVHAEPSGESWRCDVSVDHGSVRSQHVVTVRPGDLARWAAGRERRDVEHLVARSFDFLLEREPANAILATFELTVIQRYFPEYDRVFTRK